MIGTEAEFQDTAMGNSDSVLLKPEEQPGQGDGAPERGGGEEQPGRLEGGARGPGPEVARDKDKTFNISLSLIPFHFLGYIFP